MQKIEFKDLPDTTTPLSASNLNTMQDNIENEIEDLKNDEWQNLSLTSNWSRFSDTFNIPSYSKRGNFVYLRGLLKRSSNIVGEETIATLPENYRPLKRILLNVPAGNNQSQRIDIWEDGTIKIASTVVTTDMLSIENIGFYVD